MVASLIVKRRVLSDEWILLSGNISVTDTFLTNQGLDFDVSLFDEENEEKAMLKCQI